MLIFNMVDIYSSNSQRQNPNTVAGASHSPDRGWLGVKFSGSQLQSPHFHLRKECFKYTVFYYVVK